MLVIVGALTGIILIAVNSSRPYIGVSEIATNPARYDQQEVEVIGNVQNYTGGNFRLVDKTDNNLYVEVDVSLVPTIPAELANATEIVVRGQFISPNLLKANQILTQCS